MLLYSSFKQIDGISEKQECKYWNSGTITLAQLLDEIRIQKSFYPCELEKSLLDNLSDLQAGRIDNIFAGLQKKSNQKDLYRIAYSFPRETMFLDIETTGLSTIYHYITLIGWLIDGQYNFWLPGMDISSFYDALRKAKLIITFNGIRFDCPFIQETLGISEISKKPILDLMYLCRNFGYKKGQKNIESALKFKRPANLIDCDGKEAIALWYQFLFGDNSSLKKLISYNFYDIKGMTYILDYIFFHKIYGKLFPHVGSPKPFYIKGSLNRNTLANIDFSKVIEFVEEHHKKFDITKLSAANDAKIVGIDLAGVINKTSKTGICLLIGKDVKTAVVKTNDDIIEFITKCAPDLVSIDAPLSLPKGRTTVYNDDPMYTTSGITRYCERVLKRRRINVYPALINSMQELTKRGIELSKRLKTMGYSVIECFPGAAQDILQLPRKRTDQQLLKTGLIRLGIKGDFMNKKVYHDELDAITAALVGQFFLSGYYEAIGIPEENDLIIPSISKK